MSDQAVDAFVSVEQTLTAVEEHLKIFKQNSVEELIAELNPLERAKVQVSLAYTVNALLYVFLKTQGVSAKDIRQTHVKQELDRVKAFIKKIKDTEELAKGPRLTLDKEASKRFVHNALSSDQVYVDALEAKKLKEAEAVNDKTTVKTEESKNNAGSEKKQLPTKKARGQAGKSSAQPSRKRRKQ